MCDKVVLENSGTLKYVPDCYKIQKMCNKVVPRYFIVFDSIPYQYKIQEICELVGSLYSVLIVHCPDKHKTHRNTLILVANCTNFLLNSIHIDTNPLTVKYVPECYKTRDMCNKVVHRYFIVFDSILINRKFKKYMK